MAAVVATVAEPKKNLRASGKEKQKDKGKLGGRKDLDDEDDGNADTIHVFNTNDGINIDDGDLNRSGSWSYFNELGSFYLNGRDQGRYVSYWLVLHIVDPPSLSSLSPFSLWFPPVSEP